MKKILSILIIPLLLGALYKIPAKHEYFLFNENLVQQNSSNTTNENNQTQLYCAPLIKSIYYKINTDNNEYKDFLDFSSLTIFTGLSNLSLSDISNLTADELFSFQDYQGDYQILYENNVIYDSTLEENSITYIDNNFQTGTNNFTIRAINSETTILDGSISFIVSEPLPSLTSLLKITKLPTKTKYNVNEVVSFEGIEVQKLTYTAEPILDSDTNDLYQYHVSTTITNSEILYYDDLDISLFQSEDYTTGKYNQETNTIESLGFYPFIIGQKGYTNGSYQEWDPQFTLINFFVIMFLNNIVPYINLEIISLPSKLTYYNDEVYAPTGLNIGYTLTLDNEKMPFNIKLLYYTAYYIDNNGSKVNLEPGITRFTNINEGIVTIFVDQTLGETNYQVSYDIEFIDQPNPIIDENVPSNDQYIMYFSITLGLIFIFIGGIGLAIHLILRRRKRR